jgi:precorrin-8X/cobalt-precorrin-8 methylmutase
VIVSAVVAPHGGLCIEDWCEPGERELARVTRNALRELGHRVDASEPDAIVIVSPHGVLVEDHFGVVLSGEHAGSLEDSYEPVELVVPGEPELARSVLAALRADDVPALGVTYGSSKPESSTSPMDWGTLIPLWFLPTRPTVVVTPSRALPLAEHVRAGRALARGTGDVRVALVASADHSHTHGDGGPYHVDAEAARDYDTRVVEILRENRLEDLLELGEHAATALADSLWQLLVLHGALGEGWTSELLSYEAPTYYGMACAAFTPPSDTVSRARARPGRRTTSFDSYVVVDWSAASQPKTGKDSIWIAVAGADARPPQNPPTRAEAAALVRELLVDLVGRGRRVLVGFDFPYGYPHGFGAAVAPGPADPWRRVWDFLSTHVIDDDRNRSNRYDVARLVNELLGGGPFWGCPRSVASEALRETKAPFPHAGGGVLLDEFREVERRLFTRRAYPKSVWQLAYAGSVGSQALTGIPRVAALRDDPALRDVSAVWPFETGDALPQVLHAEIWPAVVTPEAVHDVPDARQVLTLAATIARWDADGGLQARLDVPPRGGAVAREEGWILGA